MLFDLEIYCVDLLFHKINGEQIFTSTRAGKGAVQGCDYT